MNRWSVAAMSPARSIFAAVIVLVMQLYAGKLKLQYGHTQTQNITLSYQVLLHLHKNIILDASYLLDRCSIFPDEMLCLQLTITFGVTDLVMTILFSWIYIDNTFKYIQCIIYCDKSAPCWLGVRRYNCGCLSSSLSLEHTSPVLYWLLFLLLFLTSSDRLFFGASVITDICRLASYLASYSQARGVAVAVWSAAVKSQSHKNVTGRQPVLYSTIQG